MNGRRIFNLIVVALLLLALAPTVLAADASGGDGVHFGPYTLGAGESVSGDLLVIGPVELESDSTFEGDLAVFGPITIAEGATVDGDLSVFGEAVIAGTVTGDCSIAGSTTLRDSAVIEGDLSVAGPLSRAEGATVYGDTTQSDDNGVSIDLPYGGTFQMEGPRGSSLALQLFWRILKSGLLLIVALLFALLIVSVWPKEIAVIGETITETPPISFLVGLGVLATAAITSILLTLTICLSPVAFLISIAVGIGAAVGWIALGAIIGNRLLALFNLKQPPSPLVETLIGTFFLTALALLINLVSSCLFTIIVWPLAALGVGAVLLTRFGTEPYSGGPIFPTSSPSSLPAPTTPAPEDETEAD